MSEVANLRLIGAGYGRTGTDSMRTALEMLGFGPCHHMRVLADNPDHKADWKRCIEAGQMDWDLLLGGFASCVDWPSASYWPDLVDRFPNAKVLLTWRTAESWYASMEKTILPSVKNIQGRGDASPGSVTLLKELGDRPWGKDGFIAAYEANVAKVQARVPAGQLLIYKLGDGWGPLCEFLEVDEPKLPFPRSNNADEFHKWGSDFSKNGANS